MNVLMILDHYFVCYFKTKNTKKKSIIEADVFDAGNIILRANILFQPTHTQLLNISVKNNGNKAKRVPDRIDNNNVLDN